MLKYALLSSLLVASSFAADTPVPQPPACLSGPVTLGNVTLTCSLIDTSNANGASAAGPGILIEGQLLQVRMLSTDPDVVGFRVGVLVLEQGLTYTIWGTVGKSTGTYPRPDLNLPQPTPGQRYTFVLAMAASISGIQVQELKASSSQSF